MNEVNFLLKTFSRNHDLSKKNTFKLIIERLPVPIIAFDRNLRFMAASDRFFDESPLEKRNVHPDDHWYSLIPDMPIKWKKIHQRCLQGEELKSDEDLFYRKDGSIECWKWEIRPWYLSSREIGGVILYVENITARKMAEIQLQESISSLEKSNDSLSKFANICAHDLNQSLRTISLYAQMAQTKCAERSQESLNEYTAAIINAIDQMKKIVENTLVFSRSIGKNIIMTNFCMEDAVQKSVMLLTNEILKKEASVTYDALPYVRANKDLIIQLMQNLISNSLKYTNGSPIINIRAVDKGNVFLFSVEDNGIGIESKYLRRIFSENVRVNYADQKGSGLGLSHCKKIIKSHGGRIWASSCLEKGTTIFFTLPQPVDSSKKEDVVADSLNLDPVGDNSKEVAEDSLIPA